MHGNAIAPMRMHATIVNTHSGRLPMSVITTSPRRTPRAVSAPERPALRAINSPNAQTRRLPSREMVTIAGRDAGNRSSTS